jgi:hypothetical protein
MLARSGVIGMKNDTVRNTAVNNKGIAVGNGTGSLFFVMPAKCSDVHKSAKKLIAIGKIKEVMITEGSYGFVVRTEAGAEPGRIGKDISRVVGGVSRIAVCHYLYRK